MKPNGLFDIKKIERNIEVKFEAEKKTLFSSKFI